MKMKIVINVAALGVVTKSPSQRHVINTLDDADFGGKADFFVEGGKPKDLEKSPQSQIEINQSQPTYEPRIEPGGRSGGRRRWWPLRQPDPH